MKSPGWNGTPAAAALYLPDADFNHWPQAEVARWSRNYLSVPVDGVPNFTRAPEVWFWTLRHYRTVQPLDPGRRWSPTRRFARITRISMQVQPLGLAARTYPINDAELYHRSWIAQLARRLRLPALAAYGSLSSVVEVAQTRALAIGDQPRRRHPRLSMDDSAAQRCHDVWFYPWDATDLASYFNADESQWRLNSRSAIIGLRLVATPLDWVSQQPDAITIDAVDAVRLTSAAQ